MPVEAVVRGDQPGVGAGGVGAGRHRPAGLVVARHEVRRGDLARPGDGYVDRLLGHPPRRRPRPARAKRVGVERRERPRLRDGDVDAGVAAGEQVELDAAGPASGRGGAPATASPAGQPGVELGRAEAVAAEDAVDAEGAAVAGGVAQVLAESRARLRIASRSAAGGSQVVPCPPNTKRRPVPRRIASSTGRNTAVPSGSTRPWMLHGTPSTNGMTRTRSQRGAKNVERAGGVLRGRHPAHEVAAAVEPVAGVAGPHHAARRRRAASVAARSSSGSTATTRRLGPGRADGVPEPVRDELVLEREPARRSAGRAPRGRGPGRSR